MVLLRSLCRTAAAATVATLRSSRSAATNHLSRNRFLATRGFFTVSSSSSPSNQTPFDLRYPQEIGIGQVRRFSEDVSHMPEMKDSDVLNAFKDLMAADWAELPSAVVEDAKSAISKNTDDKAGQEALKNVFRAAEAVEEFGGILTSIKMEIDDSIGMSGEGVKPLPNDITDALRTAYQRYADYLESFEPEEVYLKKKVEMELGTKMIHLKMRCSGLGSEWGKVTVLGTSGLSGSYVEKRA
ncbi:PREDICTED: succinate dehydrogenase subunit 5, mitochondrial [Camelina sativa]|uniref:Succinate dehydrogenase subunit 5, mitochondrial n=1 Tax=Camelina sativa TaxID=90675 RepID=A0ABM0YFT6_CAMSA|nr:PREDICTED: succinate dehydrogenase subunit 5, mitochondrial [Camelina sativa]